MKISAGSTPHPPAPAHKITRGRFQTLSSPQEVFRSISQPTQVWRKGVDWPRDLRGATPANQIPSSPNATRWIGPRCPPPHLSASGASWGLWTDWGWGSPLHHFPPRLRKVRAGKYSLSDSGRGGWSRPQTPHSSRPGREEAGPRFLRGGRALVALPAPPNPCRPPLPAPPGAAP